MKKLLTWLLTLSMVLTICATNVFADPNSDTFKSDADKDNAKESWTNDVGDTTRSEEIDVNVQVNETGTPPATHNDYFRPGGSSNANAKKEYCVDITWTEVNGVFSKPAEYKWDPDTLSYVAKGGTGTGELTKVSDPKLTVNIRNRSNMPVWYKTQGGLASGTSYVKNDVITSLKKGFSMLAAPNPGTNIDEYDYTPILNETEFTLISNEDSGYSNLIEALESLESGGALKVAYFKVIVSTTFDGNPG